MQLTISKRNRQTSTRDIKISPYVQNVENMGLEKYQKVVFDGVTQEEGIIKLEENGVVRYVTGLNEFAPEVLKIEDEETRKAKIKWIRETVSRLEKTLASNEVDPKFTNKKFWSEIKLLHPDNHEFWKSHKLKLGNNALYLHPLTNPLHEVIIIAIEANGYSSIASSLAQARELRKDRIKWYLDKYEKTASIKTSIKKSRNSAKAILQTLFDENPKKLFMLAKSFLDAPSQYRKTTPMDIIYEAVDDKIDTLDESQLKKFKLMSQRTLEDLSMNAIVSDAIYYKIITSRGGQITHTLSGDFLGKTKEDAILELGKPTNGNLFDSIREEVEENWNI